MKIPYSSTSKFLGLCEEALSAGASSLKTGIDVPLEPGGYDAALLITIDAANPSEFHADWEGADPTRFPSRIKAAATALRNQGLPGTFEISHKNGALLIRRSEHWSLEELSAAVEAYVAMLQQYRVGCHVVKTTYYEDLARRFGRTSKAFEFRMQNISYVYSVMGREWLPGLKPAKHVGSRVASQLETLIAGSEHIKIVPQVAFETEVKELQQKSLAQPTGTQSPSASVVSVTQYSRDPAVKAWVLQQAAGVCECCGTHASFLGRDGLPYLEVHHVRHLSDGGADTPANTVAICPNCHRALHYAINAVELVEALYAQLPRLAKESVPK